MEQMEMMVLMAPMEMMVLMAPMEMMVLMVLMVALRPTPCSRVSRHHPSKRALLVVESLLKDWTMVMEEELPRMVF